MGLSSILLVLSMGAGGLSNIDAALSGTGRIAPTEVAAGGIANASELGAKERKAGGSVAAPPDGAATASDERSVEAIVDEEYQKLDGSLDACRIEVARRRRVPAASVAAGAVTLRWTIEPSGSVRDAEAVSAFGTDHEVAACAKRVITSAAFVKPARAPLTVERTYVFP